MKIKFFLILICFISFSSPVFAQLKEAQKIDEFPSETNCEDYLARMDALISESESNPSSKVYVFIYEGKEKRFNKRSGKSELMFPVFGSAKAKIRSMKKYLSLRKVSIDKFVFIEAGFSENLTVEVWLVPDGATPPKPTPTSTKMKYRKGKALGFCLGCCE